MFVGGDDLTGLSEVRKPMFPIIPVDHRTGEYILLGHMRFIPFKMLREEIKARRVPPAAGVSSGENIVTLGAVSNTLTPTPEP